MTKPKPLPKLKPCLCGRKAGVSVTGMHTTRMVRCGDPNCWQGPIRCTPLGAINAWNRRPGEKGADDE
jgi:hypothetical protein